MAERLSVHARLDHDLVEVWRRLGRSGWLNQALRVIAASPAMNPAPAVIRGETMQRVYAALPGDWRLVAERTGLSRNAVIGPLGRLARLQLIHVSHRLKGSGPMRYWYSPGPGTGQPLSSTPVIVESGKAQAARRRKPRPAETQACVNRDPLMALYGKPVE